MFPKLAVSPGKPELFRLGVVLVQRLSGPPPATRARFCPLGTTGCVLCDQCFSSCWPRPRSGCRRSGIRPCTGSSASSPRPYHACLPDRRSSSCRNHRGRPPVRHIEALIGLGEIGYVRGIQLKLDEIGSEHPEHAEFVAQMRSLVDRFDLDQYMTTLKTLHAYEALRRKSATSRWLSTTLPRRCGC